MALVVDRAGLLFDTLALRMKPLRDALLLAGLYYTTKWACKGLRGAFQGFKTFALPVIWPRDFPKEYGAWAVITGCTRGIGLCFAQELARRGMHLVLIGRDKPRIQSLAEELMLKYQIKVEIIEANFAKGQSIYEMIKDGLADKEIGILVNNVGVIPPHPMYFHEVTEDQIWNLINVNIASATMMTKIVLPKLMRRRKGAIINLASSAALDPQPLQQVYTATKAYMDFFSKALACEYAEYGITIQTVSPMYVCTEMVAFSDSLSKPTLLVPSPEAFAAQAIRTLGFSSNTTGYWSHGLQTSIMGFFIFPKLWITKCMNQQFRKEAMKKLN